MSKKFSFRHFPIRLQLIASYSAIFIFSIFSGSTAIWYFTGKTIETDIQKELNNATESVWNMVSAAADISIKSYLRAIAETNLEIVKTFHQQEMRGILTRQEAQARSSEALLSQVIGLNGYIYCIDSQGVLQVHPKKPLLGKNISKYDFVKEQIRMKNGYINYRWKNPDEPAERSKAVYMTYFEPWDWIISASSYRSEFSDMILVDAFSKAILPLKIGGSGYPFILDPQGNLLLHPTLQGQNILDLTDAEGVPFMKEICKKKNGTIAYSWQETANSIPRKMLAKFRYLPELNWIVVAAANVDEFYGGLRTIQLIIVGTGLLTILLIIPLSLWVSTRLVRPLNQVTETARRLARLDMTVNVETDRKDEIGGLLKAVRHMVENLRQVLSKASGTAGQLDVSSHEIAEAVSSQAATMTQQSAAVTEISSTMEEFSGTSSQIAMNAGTVVDIADDTLERAEKGSQSVSVVMEHFDGISQRNDQAIQEINHLSTKVDEIAKVMEIINNIADQTRLIAFNAAIEASSAGEAGRRFGVVAAEIRRLADSVMDSTDDIGERISDIQKAAGQVLVVSESSTKGIQKGLTSFEYAVHLLDKILEGARSTSEAARQISLSTRQQKTATEQVVNALRDIADGADQTSASANQITGISNRLAGLSDELKIIMDRFVIGRSSAGSSHPPKTR